MADKLADQVADLARVGGAGQAVEAAALLTKSESELRQMAEAEYLRNEGAGVDKTAFIEAYIQRVRDMKRQ